MSGVAVAIYDDHMNVQEPVGVFDSGLGGLSVLWELRALLPRERWLYYADCAHCPYGERSPAYILDRCTSIMDAMVERGAKVVVVACNTATSVALAALRARYGVPIVGMVPAVKPAAAATRSGRIGVLATPRTVTGEALAALIREHASGTVVSAMPAPGLVELVEAGRLSGPEVEAALRPVLCPLLAQGMDTLVLGCTHYPFLRGALRALAGPGVALIDSGEAVARRTREVLGMHGLLAEGGSEGTVELLTSGEAGRVSGVASRLLGEEIVAANLPV